MGVKVLDRIGNKVLIQGRRNGITYRKWVESFHSLESKAAFGKRDCKLSPKLKKRFIHTLQESGELPAKPDYKAIYYKRVESRDDTPVGRKERTQIACEPRLIKRS